MPTVSTCGTLIDRCTNLDMAAIVRCTLCNPKQIIGSNSTQYRNAQTYNTCACEQVMAPHRTVNNNTCGLAMRHG